MRRVALLWGLLLTVVCGLTLARDSIMKHAMWQTAQVTSQPSSQPKQCVPANILYFNLQPSSYGRDGELPEFQEMGALGFDITLANRNSVKTITSGTLDPYNVLWLHGGCGGASYPLANNELTTIRNFYMNGGSLIIDAGDNYAGGVYGPAGADCQQRANQIAENLGVQFTGKVQYGPASDGCRPIGSGTSALLTGVQKIFRESSGEMLLTGTVSWGKAKPEFHGTISATGVPVLAAIAPEDTHGGAVFSPQDQGLKQRCSGQQGQIYKNIMEFLGHGQDCVEPQSVAVETPIAGGSCSLVSKTLYGSGAVRVACPDGTVIMGGGWNNGTSKDMDFSRPFEVGQGWECEANKDDPAGGCTAICCDSFLYESIVTYRDGGLSDNLVPVCPQAYQLLGGGFIDGTPGKDEDVLAPQGDVNGWRCYDEDSKGSSGQCFALCGRRKGGGDIMQCATHSLSEHQTSGVTVACPPGTFVSGGGFEDLSNTNADQDMSLPTPNGDGWMCQKTSNNKNTLPNICYARCCTLSQGVLTAALSSTSSTGLSSTVSSAAVSEPVSSATAVSSSTVSVVISSPESSPPSSAITASKASSTQGSLLSQASTPPAVAVSSAPAAPVSSVPRPPSSAQVIAMSSASSSVPSSAPPTFSSQTTVAPSSAPSCPADICVTTGDAYCGASGLHCAEIASPPCFVCLAHVGVASSLQPSHRSSYAPSIEVPISSLPLPSSSTISLRSIAASSQFSVRATSSSSRVTTAPLPAALIEPWQPSSVAHHAPLGATGPGALAIMVTGAATGIAWMRKRRK